MANEYTTIAKLQKWESDRHLINSVTETRGQAIGDANIISGIEAVIEDASRDFDGYVEGYMDVPFEEDEVPAQVELLVRGYTLWLLWERRGRREEDNPHEARKKIFDKTVEKIQTGRIRFELDDGTEVNTKLVETDTTVENTFDDDSFGDYTPQ